MDKLFVGAGREVITPPIGTCLFGYRPGLQSTSVNDDLTVTAVAFGYDKKISMLITIEVCEISDVSVEELREKIENLTNVPKYNIIFCATHTHSGPITVGIPGWGDVDREFCDNILVPQTIKAAKKAYDSMIPAKMGIGTVDSDIGINRRQIDRHGNILLGQNPWGPYDPALTVLSFKGLDNTPIVNIIHYCCHGTASGANSEITRDWSGPMIDRLEQISGCLTAFYNGAEGDVGPRLSNGATSGNIKYALELGSKAAIDAVKAYRIIKEYRTDIDMDVVAGDIKLPYKELLPLKDVEEALAKYPNPETLRGLHYLEYTHLKGIYDFYKSGEAAPTHLILKQTLIRVGSVVFVPFPFEVFVEITLRLRNYSKYQHTLCLSNSNGAVCYLPSQDQICRGGYEIRTFTAARTFVLTDDVDNYIINANLNLMEEF